jgi:hypothetical protein
MSGLLFEARVSYLFLGLFFIMIVKYNFEDNSMQHFIEPYLLYLCLFYFRFYLPHLNVEKLNIMLTN